MSESEQNPIFPDDQATGNFLTAARTEMYDSLRLFQEHVKHLIALMFTVLTVVFAILGFIIKEGNPPVLDPTIVAFLGG